MSFETNVFDLVSVRASQALKNLLENKHLYQKVEITTIDIVEAEAKKEAHPMLATKHRYWGTNELPKKKFALVKPQATGAEIALVRSMQTPYLILHHVSLYCRNKGCVIEERRSRHW